MFKTDSTKEEVENPKVAETVNIPPKKEFAGKMQDLVSKNATKFFSGLKGSANVDKNTTDSKKNGYEGQQTEKLYSVTDLTRNLTPKKIVKLLLLVVMIFAIVAALYVRFFGISRVQKLPVMVNVPTPTFSPYQKYKPSIYAEDPNFKKLDEGINVLENELKNIVFEEKSLLPPTLDYNVDFE